MNKAKFLGPFYCILAAVVWGLSFVAQSEGASIGTFTFNGLRTVLGGIVLLPLVAFSHKKENSKLPAGEKKKFAFKDVLIGGLCCGLPLFIGGNLQQEAFKYLYVGKVGFITALYMVIVPLFGIFLKRKLKINIWAGVALGVAGLYFLSIKPGDFSIGKGEFVTILCSIAFAAHILVIDHFCSKVDNIALSCAQFFVAGTLSVICMFIFEEPKMNEIMSAWLPLAYAGIGSCGIAFTAQIFGQKYTNPTVASVLLCLESVFSVIFGWLLLGQKLDSRGFLGCGIMFVAVILTQLPQEWFDFKNKTKRAQK
ncbi:MAG: DMT family transporter [Clostridia bacterium]|nr:DMT family transporter [Clostridia bacterium]